MSNVVRLRASAAPQTHSESFEDAWLAFPETGRLRSSRRVAWPEWQKVADELGEADLLARVRRYAKEDKDHRKECGAPGFHRWLKWGRWEHWAALGAVLEFVQTFPDPQLRATFAERFDARALAWLDRCGWDPDKREIQSFRRNLKPEWIKGPFNRWAKEQGVKALVFQ